MQVDPIHQFEIKNFWPLFNLGGHQISFTNSALYMFIIVGLVCTFLIGATLPFIMVVLLMALELLVAFLQAYVFAILTCIYLNDAIHPGH